MLPTAATMLNYVALRGQFSLVIFPSVSMGTSWCFVLRIHHRDFDCVPSRISLGVIFISLVGELAISIV